MAWDPQSFLADPDTAVFLNADPDPGGKIQLNKFCKNKLMKSFLGTMNMDPCGSGSTALHGIAGKLGWQRGCIGMGLQAKLGAERRHWHRTALKGKVAETEATLVWHMHEKGEAGSEMSA